MPDNNSRNNRSNKKSEGENTKVYKVNKKRRKKPVATKSGQGKKVSATKKVQTPNGKNSKKGTKKGKHPKLMMAFKIGIILFLLLCVIGAGIVAGMFFGLFGDDFEITKEELKIGAANSVIVDSNGTVIADLSGDEKRKIVTLEDMAEYLPKAYVAIEDERFYSHSGVDIKRTLGAILNTLLGNRSYGGSTITQQLVKNITKEDEVSGLAGIMRKVKEWAKAYQVERMISKDQILELYLNILYVGGKSDSANLHGVELGAQYYFNKSAKDLDLAECAFLAGINSSPNAYDPYDKDVDNTEKIKNKVLTVLDKMKELGYITNEDDYNTACQKAEAGLKFEKGATSSGSVFSYHTDAVIEQLISQVMEEKGISRTLAENYIYSSGLTIYSTVEVNVQSRLEEEFKKDKYIVKGKEKNADGTLKNEHSQAGMAIINYKTGYVAGLVGELGEKTTARGQNRATQSVRQCGSSMKPLAVIAPGLQEKIITAATVYDDTATNFGGDYEPKNQSGFKGLMNIRRFIALSQNIPALKIMAELTPAKSIEYLNKMGINSIKADEDNDITLALGGTRNGATPLEMAAAYGTIANDGVYITPTFYTKVVDSNGNVVMTPNQEQARVISEQNAYITKTIVQEPVTNVEGTAKYCAIPGMDVAAKTGTTDDNYDRWLCGFTPYYAAACWYGYDTNEKVVYSGNPAGLLWSAVMKDIHQPLPNATFTRPSGIVEATVCTTTGCLPTTGCPTYKEIFTQDNMPSKCEGHGTQTLCTESNLIATPYCPSTKPNNYGAVVPKEQLKLWKPLNKSASGTKVEGTCTIHTKPVETEKPKEPTNPSTNNVTNNTNSSNNTNTSGNTNNTTNNTNTPSGGGNTVTPPDSGNQTNPGNNTVTQ